MVQQDKTIDSELTGFSFANLDPGGLYRVKAAFDDTFPTDGTLETLVELPFNPNIATFTPTGVPDSDGGMAYNPNTQIFAIAGRSENLVYLRDKDGAAVGSFPTYNVTSWMQNPNTTARYSAYDLDYHENHWYLFGRDGSAGVVARYALDGTPVERVWRRSSTGIVAGAVGDDGRLYYAIIGLPFYEATGTGGSTQLEPSLAVTGRSFSVTPRAFTIKGDDLYWVARVNSPLQWVLGRFENYETRGQPATARSIVFALSAADSDPDGLVHALDNYLIVDGNSDRVASYQPDGTVQTTGPPPTQIASLYVNGQLQDVFGRNGPYTANVNIEQQHFAGRSPHIRVRAFGLSDTDTAVITDADGNTGGTHTFTGTPTIGRQFTETFTIEIRSLTLDTVEYELTVTLTVIADLDQPFEAPAGGPAFVADPAIWVPGNAPTLNVGSSTDTPILGRPFNWGYKVRGADSVYYLLLGSEHRLDSPEALVGLTIPHNPTTTGALTLFVFASNAAGETGDFHTVTVGATPPSTIPTIDAFTASATTLDTQEDVTLTWTTTDATSAVLSGPGLGDGVTVAVDGSRVVTPSAPGGINTFTLDAINADHRIRRALTVTVGTPEEETQVPRITAFTATPQNTSAPDSDSVLAWTTSGGTPTAAVITADDGEVFNAPAAGPYTVTPEVDTTYILRLSNAAGFTESTITVLVDSGETPAPPTLPTDETSLLPVLAVDASPYTVDYGQATTITWHTSAATTVTINDIRLPATSGSTQVTPTTTRTYTITATGPGGQTTRTLTIAVNPLIQQPTATLTANPASISVGDESVLSWDNAEAAAASIGGHGALPNPTLGSLTVTPQETTTYTMWVVSEGGLIASDTTTITVN